MKSCRFGIAGAQIDFDDRQIRAFEVCLYLTPAYGMQMLELNCQLGRLPALAPVLQRMADNHELNLWLPGYMLMCCEADLDDVGRRSFDYLSTDNFATISRDDLWLACIVFCAEACAHLGDADRAPKLYGMLLPYTEQVASHPNGVCFGAVATYLGMLAALIGNCDAARAHYESVFATNRELAHRSFPELGARGDTGVSCCLHVQGPGGGTVARVATPKDIARRDCLWSAGAQYEADEMHQKQQNRCDR